MFTKHVRMSSMAVMVRGSTYFFTNIKMHVDNIRDFNDPG